MTNYKRGRETEYKIVKIMEEAGYIALRTAGSHGPWDVMALGPTGLRLIQAKRVKKDGNWQHDYEQAKEQLRQLPDHRDVSYEIWVYMDYKGFIKREVV